MMPILAMKMQLNIILLLISVKLVVPFDLNDPKTNLESIIRLSSTLVPHVDTISYINGTVYGRRPGEMITKLFYFEGYNIGQKYPNNDGGYTSLSREFLVYRDIHTQQILQVFQNPYTGVPNEVFYVQNDPVNGFFQLGDIIPFKRFSRDNVVFNLDFVLEYPNALDPDKYSRYSAGKFYNSAELFSYFGNYSELELATSNHPSAVVVTTWSRHSQFLPWLEMGTTPGSLFYTTFSWKCMSLSCVKTDIMELINSTYSKFTKAPKIFEKPNETSWLAFKKVVDQRRAQGLPDIVIPEVNVTRPVRPIEPNVDDRILQVVLKKTITLQYNGSSFTQIYSKQSINFFNVEGYLVFDMSFSNGKYYITMVDRRIYRNITDGTVMTSFNNPLTNTTVDVPMATVHKNLTILASDAISMDIPESKVLGLLMTHSESITFGPSVENERWSVTNIQGIFPTMFLNDGNPFFYGTITQFSSWPMWMKMGNLPGNLITKITFGRNVHVHH
uniref:Uncharacterized protein LOC111133042 n=1 Tax=Crassostrea virginica TaxID=6565 RepID=A0A8B8EBB9_CRAVI|nr:uncharacterized protein LOC111133042 [Crassostrea virginica]